MNKKNALFGLGGIVIGAVGGFFGSKLYLQKKFQEQYDKDIAEMEAYYGRTDEYKRENKKEVAVKDGDSDGSESREDGPLSSDKRREIKEKLVNNYNKTTNYAAQYQKYNSEHVTAKDPELAAQIAEAESQHPMDDDEEDEIIYGSTDAARMNEEHHYNVGKPPKIISAEQAGQLPAPYETKTLYYYNIDDVLVEEDADHPVEDPQLLIGDALDKYDFRNSEEGMIFVQNFDLDTVYEIQKVWASWVDQQD